MNKIKQKTTNYWRLGGASCFFLGLVLMLFATVGFVQAVEENSTPVGTINLMEVRAQVQTNTDVLITEKLEYDFGPEPRHGIVRQINLAPVWISGVEGVSNEPLALKIDQIKITDEQGKALKFNKKTQNQHLVLKIGDSKQLVFGVKTYLINYRVRGVLTNTAGSDRLAWELTGDLRPEVVKKASLVVQLPQTVDRRFFTQVCAVGVASDGQGCWPEVIDDQTVRFELETNRSLLAEEDLKAVFGWPQGLLKKTVERDGWFFWLKRDWSRFWLLWPALFFAVGFWFWFPRVCSWQGANLKGRIKGHFQELSPWLAGFLLKGDLTGQELSALVFSLATKGALRICDLTKDGVMTASLGREYLLVRNANAGLANLDFWERSFLELLFDRRIGEQTVTVSRLAQSQSFSCGWRHLAKNIQSPIVTSEPQLSIAKSIYLFLIILQKTLPLQSFTE